MKIILADDEPIFLEQMKSKLRVFSTELQTPFEVVAACYSGQEALQQIEITLPDVVFTDIRMASLDGIELAKAIHRRWPDLPVVIISGYPLFEYVLEAMRANVVDYLLKPIDSSALKAVLQKLIKHIDNAMHAKRQEMLRSFVLSTIEQEVPTPNITLHFPYRFYRAVLVQNLGSLYDNVLLMPQDLSDMEQQRGIILAQLEEREEVWLFPTNHGRATLLILGMHQDSSAKFQRILPFIQQQLSQKGRLPSLVYSESSQQLKELKTHIPQLYKALEENSVIGLAVSISLKERSSLAQPLFSKLGEQHLLVLLGKQDTQLLKQHIAHCFDRWEKLRYPRMSVEMNLKRIVSLMDNHFQILSAVENKTLETRIEEIVHVALTFQELNEAFWTMVRKTFKLAETEDYFIHSAKLFSKIESLIALNIGQPLTLQILTEEFHVSSTFLCNLFRDYSGKSFVEHVTSLRIQKAQTFMREYPHMRNKEIATIIGYADQNYFSRVFKTVVGISATEYRAQVMDKSN